MCVDCYEQAGRPSNWSPDIEATLGLVRELYAIHLVGGPLHAELDDWNIDGPIVPWYDGWPGGDLDALHYDGWPIAELPPEAPAVVEGLGRSMRQLCDDIAAKLNAMPIGDRISVLAYHARLIPIPDSP